MNLNPTSWFGSDDYYDDAMDAFSQYYNLIMSSYQPYIDYGMRAMPTLEETYSGLLSNPAAYQQMLGQGYEQSPGYQFQYDSAMNASNQAAAAGGQLATPAHQQQSMGVAQGLTNQDYWNYYNKNYDLFNQGLSGTQKQFQTGFDATNQMTSGMGNMYGSQANLAMAKGQSHQDLLSSLFGMAAGAGLGALTMGPAGIIPGIAAGTGGTVNMPGSKK